MILALIIAAAILAIPAMAGGNSIDHENNQNQDNSVTNNYDTDTINNDIDVNNDVDVTNNQVTNNNQITNNDQQYFDITNNHITNNEHNNIEEQINNNQVTNNNQISNNFDTDIKNDFDITNRFDTDIKNEYNTDVTNKFDTDITNNDNGVTNNDNSVSEFYFKKESTVVNNQITNQVIVTQEDNPDYYKLDVGLIDSQIISVYNGQVVVAPNDRDENILQREGDVFRYSIRSSLPVLAYVINSNDGNKAEFDYTVAPVYDNFMHKFDLANLNTVYLGKYRSPQQTFTVTLPQNGRFSLVIDTRVTQALDGHKNMKLTADSVDISYSIVKVRDGNPSQSRHPIIGEISVYPILENGMIDSSGGSLTIPTPVLKPAPVPTVVPTTTPTTIESNTTLVG